jgi:TonB family protein
MPGPLALAVSPLIALSRDPQLLAAVRMVTVPGREVRTAGSEVDLSAALVADHAGVLLIDGAAIVSPIATLTQSLRAQFPDLVLIVAGGHDEEGELAAQISAGTVYRFLHKPVSEQRVRLFVEAAWRRYEQDDPLRQIATATLPAWPAQHGRRVAFAWFVLAAVVTAAAPLVWMTLREAPSAPSGATPARAAPLTTVRDTTLTPRRAPAPERAPGTPLAPQSHAQPATTAVSPAPTAATAVLATPAALAPTPTTAEPTSTAAAPTLSAAEPTPTATAPTPIDAAPTVMAVAGTLATPVTPQPPEDNARFYIESARSVAPADPAVLKTDQDLSARLEDSAHQALAAKDPTQADHWAAAAADAGADPARVAALHDEAAHLRKAADAADVAAEDEARQAGSVVSENTLARTYYVAPEFPILARQRSIQGWVDLEFLVDADGAVSNIAVIGAQPVGIFEQAALDAVRHWRYRPVMRDGHGVNQRARVRVRFAMQP